MNIPALYHHCSVLPSHHNTWLNLTSPLFQHGGVLPALYRSDSLNINPSLDISALPASTKSVVVFLLDTDAPISARIHWICWDLPPTTQIQINEKRGVTGVNDFQLRQYVGPCVNNDTHKYLFVTFALSKFLSLPNSTLPYQVERIMEPYILAWGTILFFSPAQTRSHS